MSSPPKCGQWSQSHLFPTNQRGEDTGGGDTHSAAAAGGRERCAVRSPLCLHCAGEGV